MRGLLEAQLGVTVICRDFETSVTSSEKTSATSRENWPFVCSFYSFLRGSRGNIRKRIVTTSQWKRNIAPKNRAIPCVHESCREASRAEVEANSKNFELQLNLTDVLAGSSIIRAGLGDLPSPVALDRKQPRKRLAS